MFMQRIARLWTNYPTQQSLRLSPLFLFLLWTFAHSPTAQASSSRESSVQSPSQQQNTAAPSAPEATPLVLGVPASARELSGGQKHIYQLTLTQGQYAKVTVEQRGVDVVAHLLAADGQLCANVDSRRTTEGSERIELVAEASGNHRIEIEPSLPKIGAGTYSIQVTEVREATANDKLLHEARNDFYESQRLSEAGKTDKALELGIHALDIRERLLGSNHVDVAASLLAVGTLYSIKNDLTQAEAFLQRAAAVTANNSGVESLDYADVLHGLARVRYNKGDHAQSEQLNQQSLAVREKVSGPESLPVAVSLNAMAWVYRATNDLPKAEQMYRRGLTIREKLQGTDHLEVGKVLNDLGLFYYGAGDYRSAEAMLQRSLAIREKVLGPEHDQVGRGLNNLGLLEWKRNDYEKAQRYYQRALSIFERTTGPESDGVASISHNLGIIYKEAGQDYAKAEEYYQRALAIWEKIFGEQSSSTGNAVASLGILYQAMGDYDRAEKFHLRGHAIREKVWGPDNQYTVLSLKSLARLYVNKGDFNRALEYQRRISEIEEKIIPLNLTLGSERQKIAYFTQLQKLDRVISLHVNVLGENATARDLAATTVLQRKGRILDALSANLAALRRRFSPKDHALLDSLNDINSRLARLVLNKPQKMSAEEHQKQVGTLKDERERLEAEIGRRSAGFYEGSEPITLAAVREAIPADAALVEFAVYRPFEWKAKEENWAYGEPRYVAYVIRNQNEVRWAELGAGADIDKAVDAFRQALRDPLRKDAQQLARAVDLKVMQPVRALLGGATQVVVSPDGELNLIPFEALVDEQGHYLIERYAFTYLTSGRDLLRMQVARESKSKPPVVANPLVVADPSFNEPVAGQLAKTNALRKPTTQGGTRSVTNARDLSEVYFAPLGGTADEARTILKLFRESELLTGARATESALKRASAPRLLHIATHGFFLQDAGDLTTGNAQVAARGTGANARIENPLLRSGLALAGANLRGEAGGDDGILTALEASGLNLWGTKLVVLSACDTGLGEVRNGEGVYGLRRAFVLAGAESLVMSLWPVSDYPTKRLMTGYYENLRKGMGRGEALRRVQLDMLRKYHPFYWANFIQSGEWANLDGERLETQPTPSHARR